MLTHPLQPMGLAANSVFVGDKLEQLELRVAQRADALARLAPTGGSAKRDRETWLRAEHELLPNAIKTGRREASHQPVGACFRA